MMKLCWMAVMVLLTGQEPDAAWWVKTPTGTEASLRGVSVAQEKGTTTIWATGSKGTVLRSTDAGTTWEKLTIPQGEELDFRGVQSFGKATAFVMSSGPAERSRIYKTTDAGATWEEVYRGAGKDFFLDAIGCADETHCFALSDPVNGKFVVLRTEDGTHWKEIAGDGMPAALKDEGAFAASNSALLVFSEKELYFGTGGAKARVFHTKDAGKTWTVSETPVKHGKAMRGIFSIARAGEVVVAVGGDYDEAKSGELSAAVSRDEGKTWQAAETMPGGYRSSVTTYDGGFVAVGLNGADVSRDGKKWMPIEAIGLNALTFEYGKGWGVGPKGLAAKFLDRTEYGQ